MADDRTIKTLNALLAAEYGNLIQRLSESDPFISLLASPDGAVVKRMIDDTRRHQRELAEMILSLRGSPISPTYPTSMGGVNYLELSYLLPQIIASLERLIAAYESAGSTRNFAANAVIGRILADHKRHLAELTKPHENLVQTM